MTKELPLITHVVHRFDIGGMENGVVNLINRLPADKYRHAIVALTDYTDFKERLNTPVELRALHKKPGHDLGLYWRLFKTFRELKPSLVHTRNLAALEAQIPAWLAGSLAQVHGLHGWDIGDLAGDNKKYRCLNKCLSPFIDRYIALSSNLEDYLERKVGVSTFKIDQIYNGVDTEHFVAKSKNRELLPEGFDRGGQIVIGTVGRLELVKDQRNLVDAFIQLVNQKPVHRDRLRLVIIGDGSQRESLEQALSEGGCRNLAWFAGARDDICELLNNLDVFVLPSKAEGISNTILEAMAMELPVVATDVGGNSELVISRETGFLVEPENAEALASAIYTYVEQKDLCLVHGKAGRKRVESNFSIDVMVKNYQHIYDELLTENE